MVWNFSMNLIKELISWYINLGLSRLVASFQQSRLAIVVIGTVVFWTLRASIGFFWFLKRWFLHFAFIDLIEIFLSFIWSLIDILRIIHHNTFRYVEHIRLIFLDLYFRTTLVPFLRTILTAIIISLSIVTLSNNFSWWLFIRCLWILFLYEAHAVTHLWRLVFCLIIK